MRKLSPFLLLTLSLLLITQTVYGHATGNSQLNYEIAGDCWAFAWTRPDPATAGVEQIIEYAVYKPFEEGAEPGSPAEPQLELDVTIQITHPETGEVTELVASQEDAEFKIFYLTTYTPDVVGEYEVTAEFTGTCTDSSATFMLEVGDPPSLEINWPMVGGIGVALVTLLWIIQSQSKQYDEDEE